MMRVLMVVLLLGVSNVGFAAFVSGHELMSYHLECDKYRGEPGTEAWTRSCGIGQSYIMGVFDTAHSLNERWLFLKRFCKPYDVDRLQLSATVKKYMTDHPEQMDYAAAGIVFDALSQAYPCD